MEEKETTESNDKPWLTQMVRELALTGVAAVFMTEDSVRKYLKDLKLPKELGAMLLDNIAKKKDDFYELLAKEFGSMLSKFDLSQELAKFLQNHSIRLDAKISFEPKQERKDHE